MEITYDQLSCTGPVRTKNEDALGFYQPVDEEERRWRGTACIICDGVGGQGDGDIASQMAVRDALEAYRAALPEASPTTLLRQMFNTANLAVYEAGLKSQSSSRMATTMTVCLLRNHEAYIGHVGDCRVYHIHGREIRCVTTDHSYSGMQMKLGLINAMEAANSQLRYVLTRSLGKEAMLQVDFYTVQLAPGDVLVQCCDGVYSCMSDYEILEAARNPESCCRKLIDLCERRGADDNVSLQVIQVREVERVTYYRGLPLFQPVQDPTMGEDLQIDHILDGRYQIIEQIAKSGMASIYRGIDVKTGSAVALKVPYMQFESDPNFYERFQREREIGKRLNHPYIIHIESPDDLEQSRPYLVMEYLSGQTLGQLMKSIRPMPETDALRFASRICDALQYLHENQIVHRDLKPDNIMVCDDGSLRMMDFGIAKVTGARRLTFGKFQPAMGTPDYMSPEQVKGGRGDARTDIYSLGTILYEMATGYPPFEGNNPLVIMNARLSGDPIAPRLRNPNLSEAAEEIILHAMARKPEDRYQIATEMRRDLDYPFEVQITHRAHRLVPVTPMRQGWKNYWIAIALVIAGLIILVGLFAHRHIHVEVR